jgi:hypothetical protein
MTTAQELSLQDILTSLRAHQEAFQDLEKAFGVAPAPPATTPSSTLDTKIKRAIVYGADDGILRETEDGTYGFTIGGEEQFYAQLVSLCTPGEKTELMHEWLLTGDEDRAVEVVDFLMADFNPIKGIARASAVRIINHFLFRNTTAGALMAEGDDD